MRQRARGPLGQTQAARERWLVSYADFVTLLFAFFVALYAISVTDGEKARALLESLRSSFGASVLPGYGQGDDPALGPPGAKLTGSSALAQEPNPDDGRRLETLLRRLHELELEIGPDSGVSVHKSDEGIAIRLADSLFFSPAAEEPVAPAPAALARIAALLADLPNHVRIEGHTDDTPVDSGGMASHWQLAALRAVAVLRALGEQGIPNYRLSLAAFGSERPLASNASAAGRAANRRVELVVLRARPAAAENPQTAW